MTDRECQDTSPHDREREVVRSQRLFYRTRSIFEAVRQLIYASLVLLVSVSGILLKMYEEYTFPHHKRDARQTDMQSVWESRFAVVVHPFPGTSDSRPFSRLFSRSGSTIKSGEEYSSVSTDLTQLRDCWYTSRDV